MHNKSISSLTKQDIEQITVKRAAVYVRMSTDKQECSLDNQLNKITEYAKFNHYEIVEVFRESGKSGLNVKGRPAFLAMIDKVESGSADFSTILVYDVSRWGRFQHNDAAGYYQYRCELMGVNIIFCAEPFSEETTPFSGLLLSLKRQAVADYSKELSEKVYRGQANLIKKGFRQGGPAGFGLRRMRIAQNGTHLDILSRGERKSLQTDRVILVPGPAEEQNIVKLIYDWFVNKELSEKTIAERLNQNTIKTDLDRDWTKSVVHQILINEKYIGHNVWNRRSFKLKEKRINNRSDCWIRAENVFEAIVPVDLYNAAQAIIIARSNRLSNEQMLAMLANLYKEKGKLSGIIIDEVENFPSSSAYRNRFGSLLRCYEIIGYQPEKNYQYVQFNRTLRKKYPKILKTVIDEIDAQGGIVIQNTNTDLLLINNEFTISIILSRCQQTKAGSQRWIIRLDTGLSPDLSIVVRMSITADAIIDYYLLPSLYLETPKLRLLEHNPSHLEIFRFDSLYSFYEMVKRITLKEFYDGRNPKPPHAY